MESFKTVCRFNPVLPGEEATMYQVMLTPEELFRNLSETADYVLTEAMDERFFDHYRTIFLDDHAGYRRQALCRITPAGLEYVPPVNQ